VKEDKLVHLEHKLQQQKMKLQQKEAYLRTQKRKAETSRKIALGNLFMKVDLDKVEEDVLLGGLLYIQDHLAEENYLQDFRMRALNFKQKDDATADSSKKNPSRTQEESSAS
jgi:hypothetical protein